MPRDDRGEGTGSAAGARSIEAFLASTVIPDLAAHFLARLAEEKAVSAVEVGLRKDTALACTF
jgi:hypothetical protein